MLVRYPSLYQINTRVWLTELSRTLGRAATLDDVPDAALDRLAEQGFDWVWFLSVWQTGPAAQAVSRANPGWRHEFAETLPDLTDKDIAGSGFAIQNYTVHRDLGGDAALARLRRRLHTRGLKLMLDFVPNHMAPDHPWIDQHPESFIHGSDADQARSPQNYTRLSTPRGSLLLAYGRDPYFDGWPDTVQLNYGNPRLQQAMIGELARIAGQCDGVRCDMAMLLLPDVFESTWGLRTEPFWPKAIESVRRKHPDFQLMAEVYWDREWTMQQQGFDYAYDKRLTTVSARGRPGRCVSISTPSSSLRTSWPASWRTTTSRGRQRRSHTTCMKRRRSSRSCPPVCVFSTRDSSRGARHASLPIWSAGPRNRSTRGWSILRAAACRAASAGRARRHVAIARLHTGLGRQLDPRWLRGLCLAGGRWRAAAGDGELCAPQQLVLRAAAVCRPWQPRLAAARHDR